MFRSIRDTLMTKSALRALRHRNFAMVELAGWSAAAGFWFYRIGLQVLTWELTHSGAWLGIVAVAEAIPLFLLLPLGGTLADRFDRLVLARFIQLAVIVVTAMLALVTVMGWINPPLLVVLAAAIIPTACLGLWPLLAGVVPAFAHPLFEQWLHPVVGHATESLDWWSKTADIHALHFWEYTLAGASVAWTFLTWMLARWMYKDAKSTVPERLLNALNEIGHASYVDLLVTEPPV